MGYLEGFGREVGCLVLPVTLHARRSKILDANVDFSSRSAWRG